MDSDDFYFFENWMEQDVIELGDSSVYLLFDKDGYATPIFEAYGTDIAELKA